MRPSLSIVILTWNRAPFLRICLERLFASLSEDVSREIIIMDNASTDDTPLVLAQYERLPNVRVVRNDKNLRLNAYKKLFPLAKGKYIVEVDDDILEFPLHFDRTFVEYFKEFPDYGYLALNVVQNAHTDGAKANALAYREDVRGDKIVEEGPTGGWCTAFRRWHYQLARPLMALFTFSMARPEDGVLMGLMGKIFRKRMGIIKKAVCFHATGPHYAREYGLLAREKEKYEKGGRPDLAAGFLS